MNSRVSVRMCALAAIVAGACKTDPTADLAGKPQTVLIDPGTLVLNEGDSANLTIKILDQGGTPLQGTVSTSSTAPTVASVAPSPTALPDPTRTTTIVLVKGLARGGGYVKATGLGVADSARINVLPVPFVFDGALSSTTPQGGSVLTIDATGNFRFDPDSAKVTFGGGVDGPIVSVSATQLKVLVPFSSADSLDLGGAVLTYVGARLYTVPTPQVVTQTGDVYGTSDAAFSTAPTIAIPAAAGQSTIFLTNVGGAANPTQCAEFGAPGYSGPCMLYKFTLAAATDLTFTTDWDGDADLDIYACSSTTLSTCLEEGGGGATGDQPQTFTFTFPAGTHYFVIDQFDPGSGSPNNIVTTIKHN